MDYIKFFELWQKKNKAIDFYYYDAEHSYKNQYTLYLVAFYTFTIAVGITR